MPIAILVNHVIAYGFIKALREFSVRIPEDVAIIGFDNLPLSSTMEPPLTTIDVSKRKIGYFAVTVLDDIINAPETQPPVKILVGAELITRASDVPGGSAPTFAAFCVSRGRRNRPDEVKVAGK